MPQAVVLWWGRNRGRQVGGLMDLRGPMVLHIRHTILPRVRGYAILPGMRGDADVAIPCRCDKQRLSVALDIHRGV